MTTTPGVTPPRAVEPELALAALWSGTRIVVVDVETCLADGATYIVAFAAVTCRKGTRTGTWGKFINPGVPIDEHTTRVHHITDDHVSDEAPFAELADAILDQLAPRSGEQVILAGHHVAFDVAALTAELERLGRQLPDLVLLDTQTLPSRLGIETPNRKLPTILAALDLVNPSHHNAVNDADSTAQAVIALLELAAEQGHTDLVALITDGTSRRSVRRIDTAKTLASLRRPGEREAPVSDEHAATHGHVLTRRAGRLMRTEWRRHVAACAELRCALLTDRVAAAEPPPDSVRRELEAVLDELLDVADPAGSATVLGALAPLLSELADRPAALAWHDRWAARIAAVGRCPADDRCPACRREQPCPVDVWHHDLAPVALGTGNVPKSFLPTSGEREGTGVFATWRSKSRHRLADHTAWLAWQFWREQDQPSKAERTAQLAYDAGGRDPRLVNVYAGLLAASQTDVALTRAIEVCDDALSSRAGDTDGGWQQLDIRRHQLAGRLQRVQPRTGIDNDGNPIQLRRHTAENPKRRREPRFRLT